MVLLGATLGSVIGMYEAVLDIIEVTPPDYVFWVVLGNFAHPCLLTGNQA